MSHQAELDAWLVQMHNANWNQLNPKERLAYLQQLENIMAAEQGRKPMKVKAISKAKSKKQPNMMGYYDGCSLHINRHFLEDRPSLFSKDYYSVGAAINTILHEGRHAWQRHLVQHGAPYADDTTRAKMFLNFCGYVQSGAGYGAQIIELDARRYARQQYQNLLERMRMFGWEPEKVYLKQQILDRREEAARAASIKAKLTEADLDAYDRMAFDKFKELIAIAFPQADTSSISIFTEAKKLLNNEITLDEFIDGNALAFSDTERLWVSAHIDAPSSFEDSFWKALGRPIDTSQRTEKSDDLKIKPIGAGKML